MLPKIPKTLGVLAFLASAFIIDCQERQAHPQSTRQQGNVKVRYHFIYLDPALGLRAKIIVYDQDLAELERLPDSILRRQFEQSKKTLQWLEQHVKKDPIRVQKDSISEQKDPIDTAAMFKLAIDDTKYELVTYFEALRLHGSATTVDLDETFSIALSWPPLSNSSVRAEYSREQADRVRRIFNVFRDGHRTEPIVYMNAGKRQVVRDLVLGTVRVSYDPEISPGRQTQLEVKFEPHAVLSERVLGYSPSNQEVQWHLRPEYHPQIIGAKYDYEQSGNKAVDRNLDLRSNNTETWAWTISGAKDFKTDPSDLIFYLGYQTALGEKAEADVWREKIKWVEKDEPGIMRRALNWSSPFLNWILGSLAALAGIWGSVETIKLRRLELATRAAPAQAPADSQG